MKCFQRKLLLSTSYLLFWLIFFLLCRIIFLLFHYQETSELPFSTIVGIFFYCLKLDLSTVAYLSSIPFLITAFSKWLPNKIFIKSLIWYSYILLAVICLLMLLDAVLYGYWHIRLDATFLKYINTPKEMLASVSSTFVFGAICIWSIMIFTCIKVFNRTVKKIICQIHKGRLWEVPLLLFCTSLLALLMRGGLQTVPINQSNAYFSQHMFANHASVNFTWNFIFSVIKKNYSKENPFKLLPSPEAKKIHVDARQHLIDKNAPANLFTTPRPNIILIMWESFSAKMVEPLGGEKGVTTLFNELTNEGILFSRFYANGNRTDKGLIAIMSGYYPQPNQSIIKIPSKTKNLPSISKSLSEIGYYNSFYYGGDMNFGNMNTYLLGKEMHLIVDGNNFDKKDWDSKWGVYDHVVLDSVFSDLSNASLPQPFFATVMTLTSHEPFEFPDEYKFGDDTELNRFKSAMAYTDKSIGNFIEKAKEQPWWDNTIIIITGDHGHTLPKIKGDKYYSPSSFHIPMLWVGGAISKKNWNNENVGSQIDIAYTLTDMLGADKSVFSFGKNLFINSPDSYAHYIFNSGYGTIQKDSFVVFDYISKKTIGGFDKNESLIKLGQGITQNAYQDFIER